MARLLDATAWARPLTAAERDSAGKLFVTGNAQLRGVAGLLLLEDPDGPAKYPAEFLAMLDDKDAEIRRATAEALGRQTFLTEAFYVALAKAARDEAQAVREAAGLALFTVKKVPAAAGQELARSYLARREWDGPASRGKWGAMLFELLTGLAVSDEVWFAELVSAATGEKPTDAPPGEIARLMGLHRKVPGKSVADLVPLLTHPAYGAPAADILTNLPKLAHEPLLAGLKAQKPADRAAAAKLLGKTANPTNRDGVSAEQWRAAADALAALAVTDPDPDVKLMAVSAGKALLTGK